MSGEASSSKAEASTTAPNESTKEQNALPTLGVLEEDDEFEEFPVQGLSWDVSNTSTRFDNKLDWDDSKTDMAQLGGAAPGAAASGGNKLWEDNWDDDDIEEEFSIQLRCVRSL